ncbi:hydroxymethylbilane synthase [Deinococcus cellulosilyticus]|uniref:Porphobilinogen deaminase n=1 Tax=Deinococcus cellulosilyticus (strain DSM 18568 / NBRC 106333 / KACC 11606 / 5516J-15) TaxID=1223518 RepID=A0A511N961_DEIC1|nr:hydroxymethylbilane synthase [Deinococcus cellulosilyticus]GEM49077.1 porphobilinogen deaminase [Deinococcus cellulosilyticus NBRC 106333 = KACC 11606]
MRQIVVGTRGSALALAQTRQIVARLKEEWPEIEFRIQTITTRGDREQGALKGDKGFFTKEIEEALLANRIDIAVHSLKDLPTENPEGLEIASIPRRVDARDALVGRPGMKSLKDLPQGAIVGTSSTRRKALLKAYRPDLEIRDLRGNVDTRLAALGRGEYDAIVLASAGLIRMDLRNRIDEFLDVAIMLPAPGQGALALQTRADDDLVIETAYSINDADTDDRITAERAFLHAIGMGCMAPVGALATIEKGILKLEGAIAAPDGSTVIRASIDGDPEECEALGEELAEGMMQQGAKDLVK